MATTSSCPKPPVLHTNTFQITPRNGYPSLPIPFPTPPLQFQLLRFQVFFFHFPFYLFGLIFNKLIKCVITEFNKPR
uniref:Putative ovule protein n=1 Tax=Solanum chacoense TaxID=4108 RepID=A0A0V0GXW8_SOLCH